MGWCSATIIFDRIAEVLLTDQPVDKAAALELIINVLEEGDWDCQRDSIYWNHPEVQEIMRKLHPRWFEE